MKSYVKPTMEIQMFAANEVVAACGDNGTTYLFECDAGLIGGSVYVESNGIDGLQITADPETGASADTYRSGYTPCGAKHEASASDTFLRGYYVAALLPIPRDVYIWTGANDNNTHCTTNLNMSSWETLKS